MKRVNKRLVLGLLAFLPISLRANTVTFTNTTNKEIVVVPTGKDPRSKEIIAIVPAHSLSLRFKLPNLRNVRFYVKQGNQYQMLNPTQNFVLHSKGGYLVAWHPAVLQNKAIIKNQRGVSKLYGKAPHLIRISKLNPKNVYNK